jgi:phytoene dehydrogenase-like protein
MYLTAVARATERAGGRIFTGTHAETIKGGMPARIETSNGRIVTADAVVVATNSPVNDLVAIHTKQAAYMTYASVRSSAWDGRDGRTGTRFTRTITDSSSPAEYEWRTERVGRRRLIVGGDVHKTGQARPSIPTPGWRAGLSTLPDDAGGGVRGRVR